MNATNKIVHVGPFLKRTLGRESRAAVDNDDDALIGPRLRLLRTSCQGQMHTEEEEEEELLFFFLFAAGLMAIICTLTHLGFIALLGGKLDVNVVVVHRTIIQFVFQKIEKMAVGQSIISSVL